MVGERLEDAELLHKARIHPTLFRRLSWFTRQVTGSKEVFHSLLRHGSSTRWEKAFYASLVNPPSTGKQVLYWSGRIRFEGSGYVAGTPLTPREAAAAMVILTMKTEDEYWIAGFTNGSSNLLHSGSGYGSGVTKLQPTPDMTLDAACRYTAGLPFGGTQCALPMIDALAKKIPADVFIVITDNETWAGEKHAATMGCDIKSSMDVVRIGEVKGYRSSVIRMPGKPITLP